MSLTSDKMIVTEETLKERFEIGALTVRELRTGG